MSFQFLLCFLYKLYKLCHQYIKYIHKDIINKLLNQQLHSIQYYIHKWLNQSLWQRENKYHSQKRQHCKYYTYKNIKHNQHWMNYPSNLLSKRRQNCDLIYQLLNIRYNWKYCFQNKLYSYMHSFDSLQKNYHRKLKQGINIELQFYLLYRLNIKKLN